MKRIGHTKSNKAVIKFNQKERAVAEPMSNNSYNYYNTYDDRKVQAKRTVLTVSSGVLLLIIAAVAILASYRLFESPIVSMILSAPFLLRHVISAQTMYSLVYPRGDTSCILYKILHLDSDSDYMLSTIALFLIYGGLSVYVIAKHGDTSNYMNYLISYGFLSIVLERVTSKAHIKYEVLQSDKYAGSRDMSRLVALVFSMYMFISIIIMLARPSLYFVLLNDHVSIGIMSAIFMLMAIYGFFGSFGYHWSTICRDSICVFMHGGFVLIFGGLIAGIMIWMHSAGEAPTTYYFFYPLYTTTYCMVAFLLTKDGTEISFTGPAIFSTIAIVAVFANLYHLDKTTGIEFFASALTPLIFLIVVALVAAVQFLRDDFSELERIPYADGSGYWDTEELYETLSSMEDDDNEELDEPINRCSKCRF